MITSFHTAEMTLSRLRQVSILGRIGAARQLKRERAALRSLDAHLLSDIGISAAEAQVEAGRPVWDAPAHWRR